jgi:hypothetical protein
MHSRYVFVDLPKDERLRGRETITVTNLYSIPQKDNLGRFSLRRIFPV